MFKEARELAPQRQGVAGCFACRTLWQGSLLRSQDLRTQVSSDEVEAESEREALPSAPGESKSDHKIALNL